MDNPFDTDMIISYLKENDLSVRQFCRLCKICPSTYKKIMTEGNCKISAVFKISKAMNIRPSQLFKPRKR